METDTEIKTAPPPVGTPDASAASWRVPAIDGVRAFALLMIFIYHVWQFGGQPHCNIALFGRSINLFGPCADFPTGVDLFMVLSGFCLFLPLCKSSSALYKFDTKKYFIRRVRRIVPPYYAAIVFVVLLPEFFVILFHLTGQPAKWQPIPSAWQFVSHLLFLHSLSAGTWAGINGSFWSMGLEAQFYLVFPLVILGVRRLGARFIVVMICLSLIYRIGAAIHTSDQNGWLIPFLWSIVFIGRWMEFALGMAAAWFVASCWRQNRWLDARLGTAALCVTVGLYALAVSRIPEALPLFPLRDLLLAIAFSIGIVALCASRTPLRILFENRAMVGLGFISYSVYLIHQPTVWYISEFAKKKIGIQGEPLFLLLCTVGLALTLIISYLFFLIFELPFVTNRKELGDSARVKIMRSLFPVTRG